MPQGDDFITTTALTPAPAPVDPILPAAPASAPEVDDPAASAPADQTPEPTPTPDETPAQRQAKADRAFAAQRRTIEAQNARIAALEAKLTPAEGQRHAAPAGRGSGGTTDPASPASGAAHGDWTSSPTRSQPSAGPAPQAPQPEAFATHADYVQAVATWAVQQHEQVKAAKETAATLQTAWESQEAQVKTKYPDYDEALDADTTRYHPAVLHAIQTSELGAEVAYHLATHPEEAQQIAALAPAAAVRALGKLEARLEAAPVAPPAASPAPTPPPTPKPKPLAPVGGAGTAGATVAPDQLPYEEYVAWYKKTYGSR